MLYIYIFIDIKRCYFGMECINDLNLPELREWFKIVLETRDKFKKFNEKYELWYHYNIIKALHTVYVHCIQAYNIEKKYLNYQIILNTIKKECNKEEILASFGITETTEKVYSKSNLYTWYDYIGIVISPFYIPINDNKEIKANFLSFYISEGFGQAPCFVGKASYKSILSYKYYLSHANTIKEYITKHLSLLKGTSNYYKVLKKMILILR